MPETLLDRYRAMARAGEVTADEAQVLAVEKLQLLTNRLVRYKPPQKTDVLSFFTRRCGEVPQGLYIFGPIGSGKTMLMDLFFGSVPFAKKRRLHFHEFMGMAHDLLAEARKTAQGDPIPPVAAKIARDAQLLCFDELHVTDIADAMILGRLFTGLFERGCVVVATSNMPPAELYKNGLNRALFLPFIDLIEAKMELMQLKAARDYRLDRLMAAPLYFSPLGASANAAIRAAWHRLTGHERGAPETIVVKERAVHIPEAAMGVARFTFDELCSRALGANDYLAIAHHFHTLILENVPRLAPAQRNEARRFITLIDTLYDHGTGLIVSAETGPEGIYPAGDGTDMFQRTVSRLVEMRSADYLGARRGARPQAR